MIWHGSGSFGICLRMFIKDWCVQTVLPSPYNQLCSHHHSLYITHNPEMGRVFNNQTSYYRKENHSSNIVVVLWFFLEICLWLNWGFLNKMPMEKMNWAKYFQNQDCRMSGRTLLDCLEPCKLCSVLICECVFSYHQSQTTHIMQIDIAMLFMGYFVSM